MRTTLSKIVAILLSMGLVLAGLTSGVFNVYAQDAIVTTSNIPSSTSSANLNITKAIGTIASLQNDESDNPGWVTSGFWELMIPKPLEDLQLNTATAGKFNASFTMIRLNGTAIHNHTITSFALKNSSMPTNITSILNGSSTVSMKEGLAENVSTSIRIMDQGTISIWLDPSKVNNHFGSTPIYGTIVRIS
jgi:hypothetical protein